MTKFFAHMHVGHTMTFVGDSWEEGGFFLDDEGNPTADPNRNTVASFSTDPVTPEDYGHIRDAYCGDGNRVGDLKAFDEWLREQGFNTGERAEIHKNVHQAEGLTCKCAYCGRVVVIRNDHGNPSEAVPAADNDEAWEELATEHDEDCEWIVTRAYRVDVARADS